MEEINNPFRISEINRTLMSRSLFEIFDNSIVKLKGEFRSVGKTPSILYFGLKCLNKNKEEITSQQINRINEPLLIKSIDVGNNTIILDNKPKNWINSEKPDDQRYRQYIGIYYDGNTEHLPDDLIISPAFNTIEHEKIQLNQPIPPDIVEKIIPLKTKVMNHYGSSTYDYSVAGGISVPTKWTPYFATYQEYSNGNGDIRNKFRPTTKFICPVLLCNYYQKSEDNPILEIRNIEIKIKNNLGKDNFNNYY